MEDLDPTLTIPTPVIRESTTERLSARAAELLEAFRNARARGEAAQFIEAHRLLGPVRREPSND